MNQTLKLIILFFVNCFRFIKLEIIEFADKSNALFLLFFCKGNMYINDDKYKVIFALCHGLDFVSREWHLSTAGRCPFFRDTMLLSNVRCVHL